MNDKIWVSLNEQSPIMTNFSVISISAILPGVNNAFLSWSNLITLFSNTLSKSVSKSVTFRLKVKFLFFQIKEDMCLF
jgi:hypothetical protein